MTTDKTPSDAAIKDFARAVLARRGQPSGAGEAAEHYRNAIARACEGWTMPDGLRKHLETALWSPPTPQPTQAQAGAVPLTPFIPAQRERLYYNRPENVGKDASLADWHRIVQYIEAAHGIKGGQHGTE